MDDLGIIRVVNTEVQHWENLEDDFHQDEKNFDNHHDSLLNDCNIHHDSRNHHFGIDRKRWDHHDAKWELNNQVRVQQSVLEDDNLHDCKAAEKNDYY